MPAVLDDYTAVDFNGKIYVAGKDRFYCYDPDKMKWSKKAELIANRPSLAKSTDLLYAIASSWTIQKYDENDDKWTVVILSG